MSDKEVLENVVLLIMVLSMVSVFALASIAESLSKINESLKELTKVLKENK